MPRYKLTIEYDGRPFFGWQRQEGQPSVQASIERACLALNGEPVTVYGAGRTDSGVHATGQVAHIDLVKELPADKVRDALDYHLRPDPVAILSAERVHDDFHARFDAVDRHYVYRILNRRADVTFEKGLIWLVQGDLETDAMQKGANYLMGQHDFSTFRDAQCQAKSPIKTLDSIAIERDEDAVNVYCSARSFLHRQVRSMVGSVVEVGRGKHQPEWIKEILAAADRTQCGRVAPPDGLYLTGVDYPAK